MEQKVTKKRKSFMMTLPKKGLKILKTPFVVPYYKKFKPKLFSSKYYILKNTSFITTTLTGKIHIKIRNATKIELSKPCIPIEKKFCYYNL